MTLAKSLSVQLPIMLGYDVLFQDVDVVWYKDPSTYFRSRRDDADSADLYFQFDGNLQARFAPYSANSGFFFARNNLKTRHFFKTFLYSGDIIKAFGCDQAVMATIISEHSSLFGLKVKVLDREGAEFPSGWHFHRRPQVMKDILTGKITPYVFHVNWTREKGEKLTYLKQMGEWFLSDKCNGTNVPTGNLLTTCCLPEPEISCTFRDKPSKHSCKDSPASAPTNPSFW